MEALRQKVLKDADLYVPQNPKKTVASPLLDTVSVSSTELSDAPTSRPVTTKKLQHTRAIVVSDDEDDEIQILAGSKFNTQRVPAPTRVFNGPLKTNAIHIPSNADLPRQTRPQLSEPDPETFDMRGIDYTPEYRMSTDDAEKALRDLMADVRTDEKVDIRDEDTIVPGFRDGTVLMPHQVVARKWMKERETGKRCGGILADDMGLGKTIQTIVRIVEGKRPISAKADGYAKATLVVCPVAVVGQWAAEIKKMTKDLTVIEHHGPTRTTDPDKLARADVVITSYSIVANEHGVSNERGKDESKSKGKKKNTKDSDDDDESSSSEDIRRVTSKKPASRTSKKKDALLRVKWWRIVLDEAHNIKNRTTKSAVACCALDGKYRWCLTGTPMQNNVDELYSLIKFLRIKPLNDWQTFHAQISDPVKKGRPQRAIKRLHVILNACMLRRTKNTMLNGRPLLSLPDRIVNHVECEFDPEERAFYNNVQTLVDNNLEKMQQSGNMNKQYTGMLVLLLRLRQACNHPSLVSKDYRKDKEAVEPKAAKSDDDVNDAADDLAGLMGDLGLSGGKRCQMCQTQLTPSNSGKDLTCCTGCDTIMGKAKDKYMSSETGLPPTSAKIRKTLELLKEINDRGEGEKTIVFSQFTSMLDLIEPFLKSRAIRYVRYDGSMLKQQREDVLEKIRTSTKTRVILISFKAGSTGLNLTCCNNVILVDLWWNPALEDQAFDRAHRLGQTRNVNIHKLSIPDTVETRILELQEKKRALATAALAGDKLKNMKLGVEDLMALFRHGGDDDD